MMKKENVLFLLIFICGVLIACNIWAVLQFAPRYIYPLDDAYIHLAIAKNFAESGIWGITSYEFSSTTSSPFFTFLMAVLIKIFGNWEYIPLIANTVAGVLLLWILHRHLKMYSIRTYLVIMGSVVLLMPLHTMIMTGMEHVFHTLSMVLLLHSFSRYLKNHDNRSLLFVGIFSVLATAIRYESLFFILFICIYLFLFKREFTKSIVLGLIALTPVVVYGFISMQNGSFFLPNSLVLKGNTHDGIVGFITRVAGNAYRGISVLVLVVILLVQVFWMWKKYGSISDQIQKNAVAFTILFGFSLHLLFANFGWLIRYEAYLVVLILMAIAPLLEYVLRDYKSRKVLSFSIFILFFISFYIRFTEMIKYQPVASKNIYEQQIQLANFLKEYYPNAKVIANDIGAITYYNNIYLLDTYGLGSIEVARLRKDDHARFRENKPLQKYIAENAGSQSFEIALVFEDWVRMPDYFSKVGTLGIKNNYICGGTTVSFYSVKKENAEKLKAQLEEFSSEVPKDVIINILD